MKRKIEKGLYICITSSLLLFATHVKAQHYFDYGYSKDSAVYVSASSDAYYIDFNIDVNKLVENNVYINSTYNYFSTLDLPNPQYYDFMDSIGRPMLPVRHIYLQIPEEYDETLYFSNLDFEYEYISLKYAYYPFQYMISDSIIPFHIYEPSYMHSPDWTVDNRIEVSPYLHFFQEKGFRVDIYPYSYDPITQTVRVVKRVRATIPIDFTRYPNVLTMCCGLQTYLTEAREYDNHTSPDRILVLSPKYYNNQLESYASYREAQGHSVTIRYLEDIADEHNVNVHELTSSIIREEINGMYHNYSNARFLLLVGNKSVIPYASGVYAYQNDNNPESDFEYSLAYISPDSSYINMKLAVGRWPVGWEDTTSLGKIFRNTKRFEEEIYNYYSHQQDLYVNIVTGIGNAEDRFYYGGLEQQQLLKIYNTVLYDGRQYQNCDLLPIIKDNFHYNNIWMFIYDGHGSRFGFSNPLCVENPTISYLGTKIPPLVWGFACSTNRGTFGVNWLSSTPDDLYGISGFFGSTTVSMLPYNNWLANNILMHIRYTHIGKAIVAGCQKFYKKDRINHMKRYVFMGDPTLHTFGIDSNISMCHSPQQQSSENKMQPIIELDNPYLTIASHTDTPLLYRIYDMNGKQLYEGIAVNNTICDISDLPLGIYLVVLNDGNAMYSTKILKK